MEEQANNLPTLIAATVTFLGCAGALVTAAAAWFKQKTETEKQKTAIQEVVAARAETKIERDREIQELHDKVIALEITVKNQQTEISATKQQVTETNKLMNIMNTQLAEVIARMDNIKETLAEIKEQNKNG